MKQGRTSAFGLRRLGRLGLVLTLTGAAWAADDAGPARWELGAGAVRRDLPPGELGPQRNPYVPAGRVPAVPKVAAPGRGPVSTCAWWSSAVWDLGPDRPHGFPMYAWPLGLASGPGGLELGLPSVCAVSRYEYHWEMPRGASGERALRVGVAGMTGARLEVTGWGDWTVGLRWTDGARTLNATAGMGLPMVWFSAAGGAVEVHVASGAGAAVWRRTGNELGVRVFGAHYLWWAPEGAVWSEAPPYRPSAAGPVAVAVVPDTNAATLDRFRGAGAPEDSRVAWTFDPATSRLTTRYELGMAPGTKAPPMALFPHQWTRSDAVGTDAYDSPRGRMKLVEGGRFETRLGFSGLVPHLPAPTADAAYDPARLERLLEEAAGDSVPRAADTYAVGKALGRLTALVPLARQAGRHDLADAWRDRVRAALEDWFDGEWPNAFRYDRVWSALYGYPAGFQSDGWLQDHVFHWGYFVQAAALMAREDPAWAERYGPVVDLLIRDAANADRGDARFPFLNAFEPYAGHIWANGPAAFEAGNNVESSSESLHFAAGVFLWGEATGRRDLRDLGAFLYATESDAVHRYWFNEDGLAFPPGFPWPVLGMLWGNGGAYATFFGGHPDRTEYIHGINVLPVTPATLHLGRDPARLGASLAGLPDPPRHWFDLLTCARAIVDPDDAARRLAARPDHEVEGGTTRAHTYHWVHALRQMGRPLAGRVTADAPAAMVFERDGRRTYVAWNPGARRRIVTFSDGQRLEVDARSVGSRTAPAPR